MTSWIDACAGRLEGHSQAAFVIETLQCFNAPFPRSVTPGDDEPELGDSLTHFSAQQASAFVELEQGSWQEEVDPVVAGVFERRLRSVDTLLAKLPEALVSEVLRLGLRVRMRQIMHRGVWPAIRLRALAVVYLESGGFQGS